MDGPRGHLTLYLQNDIISRFCDFQRFFIKENISIMEGKVEKKNFQKNDEQFRQIDYLT